MQTKKILLLGTLIAAILLQSVPFVFSQAVQYQWPPNSDQTITWTVTMDYVFLFENNLWFFPGTAMLNPDGSISGYRSQVSYQLESQRSQPLLEFYFFTPNYPTSYLELKFSDGTINNYIEVKVSTTSLKVNAQDIQKRSFIKDIPLPDGFFGEPGVTLNVLKFGIRQNGYIDIWINDWKKITLDSPNFIYDKNGVALINNVLNGKAHISAYSLTYPNDDGAIIFSNFMQSLGYSYPVHTPTITTVNMPAVNEGSSFALSGSFTDQDGWETWSAVINWGDGSSSTTLTNLPFTLTGYLNTGGAGTFSSSHLYPDDGRYIGSITLKDSENQQVTVPFTAIVNEIPPVITKLESTISYTDGTYKAQMDVDITAAPDLPYITAWYLDGSSTVESYVEDYTFNSKDNLDHTLTLIVTDSDGSQATRTITVSPSIPVVTLDAPVPSNAGSPVTFSGTYEYGSHSLNSVTFVYGDGNTGSGIINGGTFTGTHTYSTGSNTPYTVTVSALSDNGVSAQATTSILINNVAPTLSFVGPFSADEGSKIKFDSSKVIITPGSLPITYSWAVTFNNNLLFTSTLQEPEFTFASDGEFIVSLTVSDGTTPVSDSMVLTINNVAPAVDLGSDIYNIPVGSQVDFTAIIVDAGLDIETIMFNFGDGTTSPQTSLWTPTGTENYYTAKSNHAYSLSGIYPVTVSVFDGKATSTATISVSVIDLTIKVDLVDAAPSSINELGTVTFTTSFEGSSELAYVYQWFVNGVSVEGPLEGFPNEIYTLDNTFIQEGIYNIEFVVSTQGTSARNSVIYTVYNAPPTVTLSTVPKLAEPGTINIQGSFTDAADYPFTATWTVDGVTVKTETITTGNTASLTHNFPYKLGGYIIELTVTDDSGDQGSDQITVQVNGKPIVGPITYTPNEIKVGTEITFTVVATDPDEDTLTYSWNFGDGSLLSSDQNPVYAYDSYGRKTVTVTVSDGLTSTSQSTSLVVKPDVASPRALKQAAVDLLVQAKEDYGATETDKKGKGKQDEINKGLDQIIDNIEKSLNPEYWVDDFHLDPKHGQKVFNYEGVAAERTEHFIKEWSDKPELVSVLEEVLFDLQEADRILALTSLEEARAALPPTDKKNENNYDNSLKQAEYHFNKALEYIEKGEPHQAINSFKTSWEHSQKALDYRKYTEQVQAKETKSSKKSKN